MTNRALDFIKEHKAVTKLDEIIAHIPDITEKELNNSEVLKALENNKTIMKLMLKSKLFKNDTTQSIIELNKIIDKETNSKQVSVFIDNSIEKWKSNELQ